MYDFEKATSVYETAYESVGQVFEGWLLGNVRVLDEIARAFNGEIIWNTSFFDEFDHKIECHFQPGTVKMTYSLIEEYYQISDDFFSDFSMSNEEGTIIISMVVYPTPYEEGN